MNLNYQKIITLTAVVLGFCNAAIAQTSGSSTLYKSQLKFKLWYGYLYDDNERNASVFKYGKIFNKEAQLAVNTWGEGKVLILFTLNGAKGCLPLALSYVGYQNAFDSYNLYLKTSNRPEPNPKNSKPVGDLILVNNLAFLNFSDGINESTTSAEGKCSYEMPEATRIKLEKE